MDPELDDIPEASAEDLELESIPELSADEPQIGFPDRYIPGQVGEDEYGNARFPKDVENGTLAPGPTTLERWGPWTAETAAGLAAGGGAMLATKNPFAVGSATTAGEQGMSQLLQRMGLKPDAPGVIDSVDAGLSLFMNTAVPFAGSKIAKSAAVRRLAAERPGAIGESLYQPMAASIAGRTASARLKDSDPWLKPRLRSILDGATEFDAKTGEFIVPPGATKPLHMEAIGENVDQILNGVTQGGKVVKPGLVARRDEVLTDLEAAQQLYNQGSAYANKIEGITSKDVRKAASRLEKKIAGFAKTPNTTGDIAANMKGELEGALADVHGFTGGLNYPSGGRNVLWSGGSAKPTQASVGYLSPRDANDLLTNLYVKARNLGAFASDDKLDPILKKQYEEAQTAVLEVASSVKFLRDEKTKEILTKVGPRGKLADLTPDTVQNLQDGVHHLLNFKENGVVPFTEAIAPRLGSRAMQTTQADTSSQTKFNAPGMIQTAMDKLKTPFGFGPDTANLRTQMKAVDNLGNVADRFAGKKTKMEKLGDTLNSPFPSLVNSGRRAPILETMDAHSMVVDHVLSHGVQGGEKQPVRIPRSASGIKDFASSIIDKAAQSFGDEGAVDQLRDQLENGTDDERNNAIGMLLRHFPEMQTAFEPSKSGLRSEIDGKIYAKEDMAAAAKAIDDSTMSIRDKAIAHRELWDNRRYTGKPLGGGAELPRWNPAPTE